MKWFCPWCDLELTSNQAGATHQNPTQAWYKMECEYQVGDVSGAMKKNYPVSEFEREKQELKIMEENRTQLTRSINAHRITVTKLEKEWEQMNNGSTYKK